MEAPANDLEIGKFIAVAILTEPPAMAFPFCFSSWNLKEGSSFPEITGSGRLFMKDTSPAFALFHESSQVKKPTLKKPAILPKKVRRLEMRSGLDSIAQ